MPLQARKGSAADTVDWATGVASDGTDLYVVGQSRSFAASEGNAVGESDLMLLRYTLSSPAGAVVDSQGARAPGTGGDWQR